MTKSAQEDKPSIDWGKELRYSLLSLAIFAFLLPLAMEADMFPIDSLRQITRLLFAYVVIWNRLPVYILFSSPWLAILPIFSGPVGARIVKGWRGALIFGTLGAALNIWLASGLP